jgi:sugar lactone lactonase YvrE
MGNAAVRRPPGVVVLGVCLVALATPARGDTVADCQRHLEDGGTRYAMRVLAGIARCARGGSLDGCLDSPGVARALARSRARWAKQAVPACAGVDLKSDLGYFETCGAPPSPCTFASAELDAPGDGNDLLDCLACRMKDALGSAGGALFAGQPVTTACHRAIGARGFKILRSLVGDLHDCAQRPGSASLAACMADVERGPMAARLSEWRALVDRKCTGVDPFMEPGYPTLCSGTEPAEIASCPSRAEPCTFGATRNVDAPGEDNDLLDCLGCRIEEASLAMGRDLIGANLCCASDGCRTVRTRSACHDTGGSPAYYRLDALAAGETCGAHGLTVGGDGTVYLATSCGEVRTVSPTGMVGTLADTFPYYFGTGVALDHGGNAYVTFRCDHVVLRVTPSGATSVFAGSGAAGHSGDGGPATSADIIAPDGVAVDAADNVYITESGLLALGGCFEVITGPEHVRAIDAGGIIHTVAGLGSYGAAGAGGPALLAQLGVPYGIGFMPDGSYLVGEAGEQRVVRIDTAGTLTHVVGRPQGIIASYSGDGGPATRARFYEACGVAGDAEGRLFVADMVNNRVRLVDSLGSVITIAGTGLSTFFGVAGDPGPGVLEPAGCPEDVALGPDGRVYFSDIAASRVGVLTLTHF